MNNSSSCLTGISKHSETMYENTPANGFSNESRCNRMFSFADLNRILNQA